MTGLTHQPIFPTDGIVSTGAGIVLAWPEPHEYDQITDLRNRPAVAKWFVDQRKLERHSNRLWLSKEMQRGTEGLLVIRQEGSHRFIGTIGWSDYCSVTKVACFGRLMVDARAALQTFGRIPKEEPGIAVRAATLLRDYAFDVMELDMLTTWYLTGNQLAAKVNAAVGMEIEGLSMRSDFNGISYRAIQLRLSRQRWKELKSKP